MMEKGEERAMGGGRGEGRWGRLKSAASMGVGAAVRGRGEFVGLGEDGKGEG